MRTNTETANRELDHRHNNDIDVTLLWNPQTNSVSIAVHDGRLDQSLAFEVNPAEALAAFHHPYAYAKTKQPAPLASRTNH